MTQTRSPEIVRRNFTFPKEFDAKIDRLMKKCHTSSKSELLRMAITQLEKDIEARENAEAGKELI